MRITSHHPLASTSTPRSWPERPEQGAQQAISEFGLRQKGWMGFDKVAWVQDVRERYPAAIQLAQSCSASRPEYKEQAEHLFYSTPAEDRPLLRDYFAGKLGLEELSCQLSGAGAGMCDKRTAFMEIYSIASQACHPNPSPGLYL
ncbi:hypothetical protein IV102_20535 [bacterium]|nr:hypothetical protein [bacterium]